MRFKSVTAIFIATCAFALMIIPASAAPVQQGWNPTYYVFIDATIPQPGVVFSDVWGVQVTRYGVGVYEVTTVRPYRFLVASAYNICKAPGWDCGATRASVVRDRTDPRKWHIVAGPEVMISLIMKP